VWKDLGMTKEELADIIEDIVWDTYDYDLVSGHSISGETIIEELEKLGFHFTNYFPEEKEE